MYSWRKGVSRMLWRDKSDDKPNDNLKSDRKLLLEVHKMLHELMERVEAIEEALLDEDGESKDVKEIKEQNKSHVSFLHSMVFELVQNKKTADAKPSAAELYMQNKKEREEKERIEAEAKKKGNGSDRPKLP